MEHIFENTLVCQSGTRWVSFAREKRFKTRDTFSFRNRQTNPINSQVSIMLYCYLLVINCYCQLGELCSTKLSLTFFPMHNSGEIQASILRRFRILSQKLAGWHLKTVFYLFCIEFPGNLLFNILKWETISQFKLVEYNFYNIKFRHT